MDLYEEGARYAAHGPAILHGGSNHTEVFRRKKGRESKFEDAELAKSLSKKRRVFLLAESANSVPGSFDLAADAVVEVGPVLPKDVIVGAKLCLKLTVTPEQAEFIATVPLSVVVSALRRGRPVSVAIDLMKRAIAPKMREVPGPTLDDLHGLGEAGEWGRELAMDLADWQAGKIGWADVDRGILLSGPPGTGKTTFAGALARSCGVHLVLGSIARWQAKGHLGDMLGAMRAAFDEARRNAPSIIFLDEIDAVGDRERFSDNNAQYCTEVVAALLECIDGAEGREGVVVVGACNNPDRLDAALVRAGRLDRHVRIPLPDAKGREGILRWHLQGSLPGADLSEIAARTEGWSGAALEQIVRQARRKARRARRALSLDDLLSELPPLVPLPEALRRRMAIHEAGHAVVGLAVDAGEIISVSISSTALPSEAEQDGGGVLFRTSAFRERTRAQILDEMAARLGGLAAEEVFLGDRSAGAGGSKGSDLYSATALALASEASYGFGESFAYLSSSNEDELFAILRFNHYLQARVDKVLGRQFARAKKIIESHRHEVECVAEALLAKGSLTGEKLRDLVAEQPRLRLVDDCADKRAS
ncbi:AAA family ATPase [Chelativorans sp. SCAU2101]|uniref:AAA family ATPase n=2 Tax=Chelativorans petroleitrophicus TaxID=2975484 RepID=A0A9X2X6V0_9HYPH|nr:AAA family ATPase [Chelativorans petroleitrophicus]